MSEHAITPCADPANDPQDWFIRPDGKQYAFEDLLTEDEGRRITLSVLPLADESPEAHEVRCEGARQAARNNRRALMLRRRQAAKASCFRCPIQRSCGNGAIERREMHGTWGGMFEEEIAQVVDLAKRR